MIICCESCGYQKEISDKDFRREICPKCSLKYLQIDKDRIAIKPTAAKEVKKNVEEMPADIKEIAYRSGRNAVVELVKRGKDFNQIVELMKGQLQITTIRCYYGYARQELRPKVEPAKPAAESPRAAQFRFPSTARFLSTNFPVKQHKDMRIINIDVFEEFINELRKELEQIPETESTSGALIVIAQISGMLKMFKKDIYLE
jgi:hypothetical protein